MTDRIDTAKNRNLLIWDNLDAGCQRADTEFGTYTAWTDGCLKRPKGYNLYFEGGIEAAKFAAQADYDTRIFAAPQPSETSVRIIATSDLYHEDGWNDTETVQYQGNASDMGAIGSFRTQPGENEMTKPTQEKIAVMQHFADGGEVEVWSGRWYEWVKEPAPLWCWSHFDYRIARRQSTVDWSQVGKEIVAFVTTNDASTLFRGMPVALTYVPQLPSDGDFNWGISEGTFFPAELFPSFRPGNMPWRESLIVRPGLDTN